MQDSSQHAPAARPFPSLAHACEGWSGLPISLEPLPACDEVVDVYLPHAVLAFALSGSGKRWLKCGGTTRMCGTAPGMFELIEAGTHIEHARWDGAPGEVIGVELPDVMVKRLMGDEHPGVALRTHHEIFDPSLAPLVTALWQEASNGSPLGPLYTQGLTMALVGLLGTRYGAAAPVRRARKFEARDAGRLRALITEQLASDLRIERLAAAVSMSPHHFARTFKATFGQSPHAYVLEQRIDASCRALRLDADRPVADIAGACGFANQAHFTEAFRRRIGTTPARWRRGR